MLSGNSSFFVIQQGIIACYLIQQNGSRYTLGFHSVGELILFETPTQIQTNLEYGHVAQTAVVLAEVSRDDLIKNPVLFEQLYRQWHFTQAWAASHALLNLEERLLYKLQLLAIQHGKPQADGSLLIDLRLTHTQLAEAVGATRTAVTRVLGRLRKANKLHTIGTGNAERFCLIGCE